MTAAWRAWDRFFFEPTSTASLALLRIATGTVTLVWAASLGRDLDAFFGPGGLVPSQPDVAGTLGLLAVWPSSAAVRVLFAVLVVAATAVVVGYRTRLATVVAFVAVLSFARRTPFVFNSGDLLLRVNLLLLCLAPAGAALSVDRWRRSPGEFWVFPARAPWALRLVQVQLSVMYLASVWAKLRGTTWNDGTAVSYVLRLSDLVRFDALRAAAGNLVVTNLLTWGTLAVELAVGVLIWNRRARPAVLVAGVVLHACIHLFLLVGLFSLAVLASYLAFAEP